MGISQIVSYSNLFSQSYINLFNLINNRSNIPDPLGYKDRDFVYKKEPDVRDRDFKDYPFIILKLSKNSPENLSLSNTKGDMLILFECEIRSSNRMDGKHSGKGAEYLDAISNNLFSTLLSESNKRTLRGYTLYNLNLDTTDTDIVDVEGEQIYVRRFIISFKTRMVLST